MSQVNEITAASYSDTYTIYRTADEIVVATEHNKTEADALARFLQNRNGSFHSVRRNTPDQVRAAKSLGASPMRHPLREEAFKALGVW